jgi:hypothetical protein
MTETRIPVSHLTDIEIDAYWKEQLSSGDEQRVEQHLLECAECQLRVEAIEALLDGLRASDGFRESRRLTYWRIAAVFFAAVSVFLGWQWAMNARQPQAQRVEMRPVDAPIMSALLAPPTRSERIPEVTAPSTAIVLFLIDVREVGSGSTRVDARLVSNGNTIVRFSDLQPGPAGTVRVPVDGSLLAPGSYTFDVDAGGTVVGFPFLIRR